MASHDFVPTIVHSNKLNAVLMDEVEEVHMKAHILFGACPGHTMSLTSEEIGKLTTEVRVIDTTRPPYVVFHSCLHVPSRCRVEPGLWLPDVLCPTSLRLHIATFGGCGGARCDFVLVRLFAFSFVCSLVRRASRRCKSPLCSCFCGSGSPTCVFLPASL